MEPYIYSRNGLERLYGKFYENISHNKDVFYEDLEKTYKIVEKDLKTRNITINTKKDTTSFKILNKTDINISINYYSTLDPEEEGYSYYGYEISYGGDTLYSNSGLSSSTLITIPSSFLYDEATGEFNYGNFQLSIHGVNASIDATISYNEQAYRKVEIIENNKITRTLIIKNDTSIDGSIKRYLTNSNDDSPVEIIEEIE